MTAEELINSLEMKISSIKMNAEFNIGKSDTALDGQRFKTISFKCNSALEDIKKWKEIIRCHTS